MAKLGFWELVGVLQRRKECYHKEKCLISKFSEFVYDFMLYLKLFLDFTSSLIRRSSDYEGQIPLYMNVTSDYKVGLLVERNK